jgi:hypothetical protein
MRAPQQRAITAPKISSLSQLLYSNSVRVAGPKRSKSRSPTARILIEAAMNWKQGLIRLWALTSILWLLVVGYLASGVFFKPLPFRGDYQYVVQTKEMPWNIDWNKPYYETCYAPGNGRTPDSFATVDEQYIQQLDEHTKAEKMTLI